MANKKLETVKTANVDFAKSLAKQLLDKYNITEDYNGVALDDIVANIEAGKVNKIYVDPCVALEFHVTSAPASLSVNTADIFNFEYSYDRKNWSIWNGDGLTIEPDRPVYIRGNNETLYKDNRYTIFTCEHWLPLIVRGNIMALLSHDGTKDTVPYSCFEYLFSGCPTLVTTPELPAKTVGSRGYAYMFNGCKMLQTAPEFVATNFEYDSFRNMFSDTKYVSFASNALNTPITEPNSMSIRLRKNTDVPYTSTLFTEQFINWPVYIDGEYVMTIRRSNHSGGGYY